MAATMQQQRQYTFASEPRNIPAGRRHQRYRDEYAEQQAEESIAAKYGNIMYDRRIVRGNTYASQTFPITAQPDPMEQQRELLLRKQARAHRRRLEPMRDQSPEAVEGRQHIEVQTDLYLEELTEKAQETDMQTQTDAFLDRPPSPLFIPAKTGVDIATQIEEGELFDFDLEVQPILEVLVGKTIEQSLLEVMEEEELKAIRSQQKKFQDIRNAELAEQQRLEEQSKRRREEKERRVRQQREVIQKETETVEKMAATNYAKNYLQDLVPEVFDSLESSGYFFDVVEREVESDFMPWLMGEVSTELDRTVQARSMLDALIRSAIQNRDTEFTKLYEARIQEEAAASSEALDQPTSMSPTQDQVTPEPAAQDDEAVPSTEEA